jgi:hypothetical protein
MMRHTLLASIGAATIYIYKRIREENKRKKYILLCIKKGMVLPTYIALQN